MTMARITKRREGPVMRSPPLPKPERSMFDQSMFPQSLPPSPPRPRSRIRPQDRRAFACLSAGGLGAGVSLPDAGGA